MDLQTSPGLLAISLLLASPAPPAAAQGSAVRAVSEEVHHYLSPMVLELDLNELVESVPDKAWTTEATKRFVCRGVTVEFLSFTLVAPSSGNAIRTAVQAIVTNVSGKDKRVLVEFANVEHGKERIMGGVVVNVVPDERKKGVGTLFLAPSDAWRHRPRSIIQVTVTADDY